jgi:hypothetical protein
MANVFFWIHFRVLLTCCSAIKFNNEKNLLCVCAASMFLLISHPTEVNHIAGISVVAHTIEADLFAYT